MINKFINNKFSNTKFAYKKYLIVLAAGVFSSIALTGCGDDVEGTDITSPIMEVTAVPIRSETDQAIADYEEKYSSGEFTQEDYKALADLYFQKGLIRKQRDMLELGYRLYGDMDLLAAANAITVNVEEESSQIRDNAERLYQALSIEEYQNEAVAALYADDWMQIMMPRLQTGSRSYYMVKEGSNEILYIQSGYDENGTSYSNAWLTDTEGNVIYIMQSGNMVQLLSTSLQNGQYQGDFDYWLVTADNGDVYHDRGSFDNGIIIGEYTSQVRFGTEKADLFSLWSTRRDLETIEYKGDFGVDGITILEQPESGEGNITNGGNGSSDYLVYAYNEDNSKYLFFNLAEGETAENFVFSGNTLGLMSYPVFTPYDPVVQEDAEAELEGEIQVNLGDVKIRVYDSNIEWFDGTNWHVMGSVDEYISRDPFMLADANDGSQGGEEPEDGMDGTDEDTGNDNIYVRRGGGSVVEKSNTNNNTNNNGSKKPANNQPTQTTPASTEPDTPVAEPPKPTTPDNGSNNNNNGSNPAESKPTESKPNEEEPSSGGDKDIDYNDWSKDLL